MRSASGDCASRNQQQDIGSYQCSKVWTLTTKLESCRVLSPQLPSTRGKNLAVEAGIFDEDNILDEISVPLNTGINMEFLQLISDVLDETITFKVIDVHLNTLNEYDSRSRVLLEYHTEEDSITNIVSTITIKRIYSEK